MKKRCLLIICTCFMHIAFGMENATSTKNSIDDTKFCFYAFKKDEFDRAIVLNNFFPSTALINNYKNTFLESIFPNTLMRSSFSIPTDWNSDLKNIVSFVEDEAWKCIEKWGNLLVSYDKLETILHTAVRLKDVKLIVFIKTILKFEEYKFFMINPFKKNLQNQTALDMVLKIPEGKLTSEDIDVFNELVELYPQERKKITQLIKNVHEKNKNRRDLVTAFDSLGVLPLFLKDKKNNTEIIRILNNKSLKNLGVFLINKLIKTHKSAFMAATSIASEQEGCIISILMRGEYFDEVIALLLRLKRLSTYQDIKKRVSKNVQILFNKYPLSGPLFRLYVFCFPHTIARKLSKKFFEQRLEAVEEDAILWSIEQAVQKERIENIKYKNATSDEIIYKLYMQHYIQHEEIKKSIRFDAHRHKFDIKIMYANDKKSAPQKKHRKARWKN